MNDMNVSEVVENLDADQIKKLSSEDIEKLRQIFKLIFEAIEMFGRLKEQGAMEHVTMDVLNKGRDVLAQFLNVKVDYETAKAITRKSDTAFNSKGKFYQFNLSSCIRQQNSLTAQFVSFSLSNLANIFYPPQFLQ